MDINPKQLNLKIMNSRFYSGAITAIRVQDIERQIWYNWDNGVWDSPPSVSVGSGNLYIAYWLVNEGSNIASVTLYIEDDTGTILAEKNIGLYPGEGGGIEASNLDMPSRNYGITIKYDVYLY